MSEFIDVMRRIEEVCDQIQDSPENGWVVLIMIDYPSSDGSPIHWVGWVGE